MIWWWLSLLWRGFAKPDPVFNKELEDKWITVKASFHRNSA